MLPDQSSSLQLTAMTLRGIGSYLTGARLDIRPLTILCGKNGSGKSTWLKVLNTLARALEQRRLPYGYHVADWSPDDIQLTNAFYHLASPEDHVRFDDSESMALYGPPATIGLEITAVCERAPRFGDKTKSRNSAIERYLFQGAFATGTRFRVRISHPSYYLDSTETPSLRDFVELAVNGDVIRMEGERDPLQHFVDNHRRPRRTKPYVLSCSPSIINSNRREQDLVNLAKVTSFPGLRCDTDLPLDVPFTLSDLVSHFETCISDLVGEVLHGFFYVGPVRSVQTEVVADSSPYNSHIADSRREVGAKGEHASALERQFANVYMRDRLLGDFAPADINVQKCLIWLSGNYRDDDYGS